MRLAELLASGARVVHDGAGLLRPLDRYTCQGRGCHDTPGDVEHRVRQTRTHATYENWGVIDPRGGGGGLKFGRRARA